MPLLSKINKISRKRAAFISLGILFICMAASKVISLPAKVDQHMQAMFREAGFPYAKIGTIDYSLSGVTLRDVTLDSYGFDKADQIDIALSWASYLTAGEINAVDIHNLQISREAGNAQYFIQEQFENLRDLPPYRLTLHKATFDFDTVFGSLRLTADATIDAPDEKESQKITAKVIADQYQLGFESIWKGVISKDNALDISADIPEGRLKLGPLRISRFNGWIGARIENGNFAIQNRMDAGSASLFDVPMQDVSAVGDISDKSTNFMFRSGVSGWPDIMITMDLTKMLGKSHFEARVTGQKLGPFLRFVNDTRGENIPVTGPLGEDRQFTLTSRYNGESRFARGPLPFNLSFALGNEPVLSGNVLFYPEQMDIRGSLEADEGLIAPLQSFVGFPQENISGNIIRIEKDVGNDTVSEQR